MDRRKFLGVGAAGMAISAVRVGAYAHAAADQKPLRVGLIGAGWYGKSDLLRLIQVAPVEVVSVCDVDRKMLADAAELIAARQANKKTPRTYSDYRELLKPRELDLVLIGTPDHWHALPMIAAVEAGADVYVQKPISVDVAEGQAMVAAARKHGRVVQVGTQRRSTPHLIEARDRIIRPGLLGKIGLVEIYSYYHRKMHQNPPDTSPPEELDYEMWTGPAPMRPYNKLVHPRTWRLFMEYGNGTIGDLCIHMLDMVRWMMGLGWPLRVSSAGGVLVDTQCKANITDTQSAVFDYGDLQVNWQHRAWGDPPDPKYLWGATFYGDRGTLKASVNSYDYTPGDKSPPTHRDVTLESDQFPEETTEKDLEKFAAPATRAHMKNLLECVASRGKPVADIEEGHISTASCILANMSQKLGRTLAWDAAAQRVVGDDEANRLLRRPYRSPWKHPAAT
jgi:predicted dehydrogenase